LGLVVTLLQLAKANNIMMFIFYRRGETGNGFLKSNDTFLKYNTHNSSVLDMKNTLFKNNKDCLNRLFTKLK
jgi:hypothetical protein